MFRVVGDLYVKEAFQGTGVEMYCTARNLGCQVRLEQREDMIVPDAPEGDPCYSRRCKPFERGKVWIPVDQAGGHGILRWKKV